MTEQEIEDFDGKTHRVWIVIGSRCKAQGPIGGSGDLGKMKAAEMWNSRWTV